MLRRSFGGVLLAALVWTIALNAQSTKTPAPAPRAQRTVLAAIDINSAAEENIMSTLGLDKAAAKKIVDGRPYRNKRELLSRQLVSADQYNKIKDHIVARQPLNKRPVRR